MSLVACTVARADPDPGERVACILVFDREQCSGRSGFEVMTSVLVGAASLFPFSCCAFSVNCLQKDCSSDNHQPREIRREE